MTEKIIDQHLLIGGTKRNSVLDELFQFCENMILSIKRFIADIPMDSSYFSSSNVRMTDILQIQNKIKELKEQGTTTRKILFIEKMKHVCPQGKRWVLHEIQETEKGRYLITYSSEQGSHMHVRYNVEFKNKLEEQGQQPTCWKCNSPLEMLGFKEEST